ncbi:MAG: hypothetical protein FRX49_07820 [Trebouxia sp. A1-2]|nr:MAG: hypothetical protein FRX49_07820 [Trebouxia sp. A1-2]
MPPNAMHPTPQAQLKGRSLGKAMKETIQLEVVGKSQAAQGEGFTEPPVSEAKAEEQLAEKGGKAEAQRKHRNADLMQFMI